MYVFRNLSQNLTGTLGGWIQGGLFRVDMGSGLMTATNLGGPAQGTNPINVRGIAYDNITDRIYLSQSRTGSPVEVFSWDPLTGDTESVLDLSALGFSDSRVPIIGAGGGKLMLLSQAENHLGGFHREFDLLTRTFSSDTVGTPYGPYGLFAGSPVIPAGCIAFAPSVPEPGVWLLFWLGLAGLGLKLRSRH
ncbi:MAG: PEP-CTERM sorting domain-containing protein [Rubrivivax sp.]